MSSDPYQVLGVGKDASPEEIQKAYRSLAKKLHPDLNPGKKSAEDQFKEVAVAYDLLGDPDKRARFDRGEIDASGAERPRQRYYRDFAQAGGHPYASDAGLGDDGDAADFFSGIFGRGGQANLRMRGADIHYRLEADFLDAVNGARRTVTLGDGTMIEVTIPPGTRDGQILRLKGKGRPGIGGGPPGDALIEIEVRPHPVFTRKGDDIHVELPVSLREAVLGSKVRVPAPTGAVNMTLPKWSNSGRVLRLSGKGAPRGDGSHGDEYVTLKVMLPDKPDAELEKFMAQWQPSGSDQPAQPTEA